jgi:hypothetical protein
MAPSWLTLVTGEPYQPARAYYQLHRTGAALTDCFQGMDCMVPGNRKGQWLWQFEAEAERLRFERSYRQLTPEERPVTLGQFEVAQGTVKDGKPSVTLTLFSFDRLLQAIPFFDKHLPRELTTATHMRLVNHFFAPSDVEQPLRYKPLDKLLEGPQVQPSRADEILAKVEELASLGSDATERMLEITSFLEAIAQEPRPAVEELPINFYEDGIISLEMILNTRRKEALDGWGSASSI